MGTDNSSEPSASSSSQNQRRIKAHRKSRGGCFTCKGRRVKCCETRPCCKNCIKNKLQCVYPESEPKAVSLSTGRIQYQSSGFSIRDMRFFHDFMTASFPHLPLDCADAWRNDIPLIAQEHEFLMHAILALGASHLHARTDLDFSQTVERHRTQAMRGLLGCQAPDERSLSTTSSRETQLTAQLAAAYALTFTATYMGDPIHRFMVLVRGCTSLTGEIMRSNLTSPLFPQGQGPTSLDTQVEAMRSRLADVPPLDCEQIELAKMSLQYAASQLTFTPVEMEFFTSMQIVLESLDTPIEAYRNFIYLWELFSTISTEDFQHFTDPNNLTGVVLQAHFLAFEVLLNPWLSREYPEGHDNHDRDTPEAISSCSFLTDEAAGELIAWPLAFINGRQKQPCGSKKLLTM